MNDEVLSKIERAFTVDIQSYLFSVVTLSVILGLCNWIGCYCCVTFSGITSTLKISTEIVKIEFWGGTVMIKRNGAIWYIGSTLLNRLALLQRAKDLRVIWNWQPSLIPFLQSKTAYSATVEHPVGGWFCARRCAPNVEKRLSQQNKKVRVIVCIVAAIMIEKVMMITGETHHQTDFFKMP